MTDCRFAALRENPAETLGFVLRCIDEKAPGMNRTTSGRRHGRHEQMMPILVSTEDHVAADGLSYVGSEELEILTSEWSRKIETRQTLSQLSAWKIQQDGVYNVTYGNELVAESFLLHRTHIVRRYNMTDV